MSWRISPVILIPVSYCLPVRSAISLSLLRLTVTSFCNLTEGSLGIWNWYFRHWIYARGDAQKWNTHETQEYIHKANNLSFLEPPWKPSETVYQQRDVAPALNFPQWVLISATSGKALNSTELQFDHCSWLRLQLWSLLQLGLQFLLMCTRQGTHDQLHCMEEEKLLPQWSP